MNRDMILGVLRHALTTLGGGLVAKGTLDESSLTEAIGAVVTLIGVAWSVWQKRRTAGSGQSGSDQPAAPPTSP